MDAKELKPCPFCGGDAKLIQGFEPLDDSFFVDCQKCEMSGQIVSTRDAAIDAWNRRAALPHSDAAQAPAGWKLVPIELTDDMRAAANKHDKEMFQPTWASTYRAMLDAAPVAPGAAAQGEVVRELGYMPISGPIAQWQYELQNALVREYDRCAAIHQASGVWDSYYMKIIGDYIAKFPLLHATAAPSTGDQV
jgi:Lar family restriction alleviation protein